MTSPIERRARDRFDESIGTLDDAVSRKEALSHLTRYSLLCYLHDDGEQTKEDIDSMVEDDVENHINELIDAGLAARTGAPEDQGEGEETMYRITHSGRQEIKTDISDVTGI